MKPKLTCGRVTALKEWLTHTSEGHTNICPFRETDKFAWGREQVCIETCHRAFPELRRLKGAYTETAFQHLCPCNYYTEEYVMWKVKEVLKEY